jgi:hypothetical protein
MHIFKIVLSKAARFQKSIELRREWLGGKEAFKIENWSSVKKKGAKPSKEVLPFPKKKLEFKTFSLQRKHFAV